jgi:YYY domain-containing protein
MLAAVFMRLFQPDWYNDRQFHPDERWIVSSAVPNIKGWGDMPIGLQYGSLPLYILSTYRGVVDSLRTGIFHNMDMNAAYIGGARAISGLIDSGTIVFVFFTCLLLFSPGIALFASALLAFTVLNIHSSHFFTVDTFVTFFVSGMIYFSARIYKKGKILDYILAGAFYGMALASKTAAIPFVLAAIAAHFFNFYSITGKTKGASEKRRDAWINLAWATLAAFIVFFICMPHALLDIQKFMQDQNEQKRILVTGEADVPYNRQYLNTVPYLFYIKNLVLYTMGIPYGVAAFSALAFFITSFFAGIVLFFKKLRKQLIPEKGIAVILAGMIPYFLVVGASFAKFNRYMLLFTPFLAILTAKFLSYLYTFFKNKKIGGAIAAVVLLGAMFYGIAFMNVYKNPHSWIDASKWMFANITPNQISPDGKTSHRTRILNEMWGDDLPVWVNGHGAGDFEDLHWGLQEPDSPNKIEELSGMLAYTDYVIMADKRAYGTYQRLPKRYPINYYYYSTMLHNPGQFGYVKVYDRVFYPSFLGINIKDDHADESFQLYDHPRVYIFKNDGHFTKEQLKALLLYGESETTAKFGGSQAAASADTSSAARKDANNANIGQARDKTSPVFPAVSIFMWYILIQLLSFIALPLNFKVLGNMRDKGYGMAKVAGLFFFAWINWVFVSLNAWRFYQINLFMLLILLSAVSAFFCWKYRKVFTSFAKQNRRHIIIIESVFLAAYLIFVAVKLFCPDIHNIAGHGYNGGGEPMGMAYLSAIFNDVKFPPHDPWMSGYSLNYYYWGQLMLASASKLLGYAPKITYDLSLALLFALCFTAAFSLVYSMTGKYKYAVLGGFLLACAGNFHTLSFIFDKIVNLQGLQNIINGIFSFQFIWDPTRIYPTPVITEMPFFSYLYGDLHAHNIAIPVTVLAIALVYNFFAAENKSFNIYESFGKDRAGVILSVSATAIALGSMLAINTWNFPPLIIFLLASILVMSYMMFRDNKNAVKKVKQAGRGAFMSLSAGKAALAAVILSVAAYIAFIPFHLHFQSPYRAAIGWVTRPEQVDLYTMFEYFGVFFFIILGYTYMTVQAVSAPFVEKSGLLKLKMRKFNFDKILDHVDGVFGKIVRSNSMLLRLIGAAAFVLVFIGLLFLQPTFAFIFAMAGAVIFSVMVSKDKQEVFSLLLVFTSLGIIAGTELVYIADGRMNTVFKFYMVAWTFLSCGVPYLLFKIAGNFRKVLVMKKHDGYFAAGIVLALLALFLVLMAIDVKTGKSLFKGFYVALVIAVPAAFFILKDRIGKLAAVSSIIFILLPAALYPVIGAAAKDMICSINPSKGPHIDGTIYMRSMTQRPGSATDFDDDDYATIEWINSNFKSLDTVLEAPGDRMYSGLSRISIFTGMPTLIGWSYQVSQQSGRPDVSGRSNIANDIYSTMDAAQAQSLLRQYGVKYVYVGAIEKASYSPLALNKFAAFCDTVFTSGNAVLYRVR